MNWISKSIQNLLKTSEGELFTRLGVIEKDIPIEDSNIFAHFYYIKLDANGIPRQKDLLEYVTTKIVDYSIPREQINQAYDYYVKHKSTQKIIELERKAKALFTDLERTGELGELLLYVLTEEVLKVPKIISKMTLKTSGKLHYQGADGIHVQYDEDRDVLQLYWGESKMEKRISSALNHCFQSIEPYLKSSNSYISEQSRDLQLITASLGSEVLDNKLEDFIVSHFDLDNERSNSLEFKAVCFVGFDVDNYPKIPNTKENNNLLNEFKANLEKWKKSIKKNINNYQEIKSFDINVFLIPFDSVEDIRNQFIGLIKL